MDSCRLFSSQFEKQNVVPSQVKQHCPLINQLNMILIFVLKYELRIGYTKIFGRGRKFDTEIRKNNEICIKKAIQSNKKHEKFVINKVLSTELLCNTNFPIWQGILGILLTDEVETWDKINIVLKMNAKKGMDWKSAQRRNFKKNDNNSNEYIHKHKATVNISGK